MRLFVCLSSLVFLPNHLTLNLASPYHAQRKARNIEPRPLTVDARKSRPGVKETAPSSVLRPGLTPLEFVWADFIGTGVSTRIAIKTRDPKPHFDKGNASIEFSINGIERTPIDECKFLPMGAAIVIIKMV